MSELPEPIIARADTTEFGLSAHDKAVTLVAGVALPTACFAAYFLIFASGRPAGIELLAAALAAYSAICAVRLVFEAPRAAQQPAVRFGIYAGVVLALQYCVANAVVLRNETSTVTGLVIVGGGLAIPWVVQAARRRRSLKQRRTGRARFWLSVLGLALVALVLSGAAVVPLILILYVLPMLILTVAPFWALAVYVDLSAKVWQTPGREVRILPAAIAGVGAWAGAYAYAWRAAIVQTSQLHHALNPGSSCFIVTAAARGHRRFVGSWPVLRDGHCAGYANRQLITFKCLEMTMLALSPRFHRSFRMCYNTIGYPLSRLIRLPIASDVVYVLLKPPEWGARLVLRLLVPNSDRVARQAQVSGMLTSTQTDTRGQCP